MTLMTNKLRYDLLLTEKLLKRLCSCSSLAQLLQVIFMLHIQLSLEKQYEYVLTKGHAAMGKVTYQPTLVLHLLFIPGQWSLIYCLCCSLFRYTWNANVQNSLPATPVHADATTWPGFGVLYSKYTKHIHWNVILPHLGTFLLWVSSDRPPFR